MCVNQLVGARYLAKRGPGNWEERAYLDNPTAVYRRGGDGRALEGLQ